MIEFESPIQVSQAESPDELVIQIGLNDFPDENGRRLPRSVVKTKKIP